MRQLSIRLCLWLCLLPGLTSCGNRKTAAPEPSYSIASLKGPSSMGMIQLIDSLERCKAAKSDVPRVTLCTEPLQVRKLMLEGAAQMAVLPVNMAAMMYNKGLDYVMVAVPVGGSLYLAGTDTTLRRWDNFRGKRIYVMAKGMTPDALLRYLLREHGLDPDRDLTLDYSFPTHLDLAHALVASRVSAGIISEPYVSLIMDKNPATGILMDLDREWSSIQEIPIAETALLVKKDWLQTHRRQVDELLDAYAYSTLWVNAHPDSAATLIAKYGIVPTKEVALSAIPRSNLNFRRVAGYKTQIEAYLRLLYDLSPQLVGEKMPDEAFYQ